MKSEYRPKTEDKSVEAPLDDKVEDEKPKMKTQPREETMSALITEDSKDIKSVKLEDKGSLKFEEKQVPKLGLGDEDVGESDEKCPRDLRDANLKVEKVEQKPSWSQVKLQAEDREFNDPTPLVNQIQQADTKVELFKERESNISFQIEEKKEIVLRAEEIKESLKIEENKESLKVKLNTNNEAEKKPLKIDTQLDEPMVMGIDSPLADEPEDFDMGGESDAIATPSPDAPMEIENPTPDAEERVSFEPRRAASRIPSATHRRILVKDEEMDIDLGPTGTNQPGNRRRVLMDAVAVPFVRAVRTHADAERQAIEQRFEQLRNPKVKKPKNAPVLSSEIVIARLRAHNISLDPYPIDLEWDIRGITVRRDFMTKNYGGNQFDCKPTISEVFVKKTGKEYFYYFNLNYNPRCPEIPGAPGLLFDVEYSVELEAAKVKMENKEKATQDVKDDPKPYILFARLDKNSWQYLGQYVKAFATPLTLVEWLQQSATVRHTWLENICRKAWGCSIRACITLFIQLGRNPTLDEKTAAVTREKAKGLKEIDMFRGVTHKDVSAAIERGDLIVQVSTLKCVGYDTVFQKKLAEEFPLFVPDPPKPRARKPKAIAKQHSSPAKRGSASRGPKRKQNELGSDADDEDECPRNVRRVMSIEL